MTQPSERPPKPIPDVDELSKPFFDGAARGVLMIRRCRSCGTYLAPAVEEICPECLGEELEWAEAAGRATLYSFGVMHQFYHAAFSDELPYNVAIVELTEGPRLQTNIVGVDVAALRVGMPLAVTFEEVAPGRMLPKFRPAD